MVSTSGSKTPFDPGQLGLGGTALQPRVAHPPAYLLHQAGRAAGGGSTRSSSSGIFAMPSQPAPSSTRAGPTSRSPRSITSRRHPGRGVDAVGDGGDRHLVGVEARPQRAEHVAADHAVQLADAVRALREPQPHVGHVELRRVVLRAERDDPLDRHAGGAVVATELRLDQLDREPVDAGRHRRVRGEDRAGPDRRERVVEGQPVALGQLADPLDAEEAGVALVGVEHLRGRVRRSARSRRGRRGRRRCRAASPGRAGGRLPRRTAGR